MKLLLVEDSRRLRETVQRGLQAEGFTVDVAMDGAEGLTFLRTYEYELLVLDLMMPRMDGMAVLRALPSLPHRPKVLVLSARDQVTDRVAALDSGADDYLIKPFAFDELLARLHALARRPSLAHAPVLEVGPLRIDLRAHRVATEDEHELPLTPREFALLSLLARNRGRVFSRGEILERVAGSDSTASDRSIEVLVFGLRRKLDQVAPKGLIETRRGAGYLIQ
ncbi:MULTISPECIES: response regulator transcription factor [Oleiagrimonas]|jgi:DNA-binding response OmpR family regulator|uniref:Response regulator transcription factor n=1 Tax=Oleiagrimonas citrea TaxID=1665687 RepID=A0A846ZIW6_9GAMM|nr:MULTISPECIES: response regulator transcription factor [Oleiagrimonas]NKZ37637.1 response regulator transcription factor [Oleiagrimonas citrea]RAP56428.1 two-component system response regulator [Oleiagrimonas sp. MCCC 1A03011]